MRLPENAGERWLLENDPDYDGEGGSREIPWGTSYNIEALLEHSLDPHRIHGARAREIVTAPAASCLWCEEVFTPKTRWQKFCSPSCRGRSFRRKKKETHLDKG